MRFYLLLILFLFSSHLFAGILVKGTIKDSNTGEELIGATCVSKQNPSKSAITGLNGSFSLENLANSDTLVCSYLGYETAEYPVAGTADSKLTIALRPASVQINEVVVSADNVKNTESSARLIEQNAMNVVNVVSAKAIEISPDLTVANVIQRMSGVTIERNSSGDGQYAILRGMDKRFNYTLVNGVKIPSPDNKNRFVPLDIFPSELLDRLEVTKALTADMEGDGIGGAINMVMKDAPSHLQLTANLSTGYNGQFFSRDYQSFDYGSIQRKSPNEKNGLDYPMNIKDFTKTNLRLNESRAPLNTVGGFSFGGRLFHQRLGVMLAGSYSDAYRGNTSNVYGSVSGTDGTQDITKRNYSNEQIRTGLHAKFDMNLSKNHKLMWYNAYMDFRNAQVREEKNINTQTDRLRWDHQSIFNSTLKGIHRFLTDKLRFDWTLSYGDAFNETPDNTQINMRVSGDQISIDQNDGASRRWEHNSDKDKAVYANLLYTVKNNGMQWDWSLGGMFRDKVRTSYFNEYLFKPMDESKPDNPRELIKGRDWNNFDEVSFVPATNYGNLSDPLNYDATEQIGAGYLQAKMSAGKLQLMAGLRMEHTNQGYELKFPVDGAQNEGNQDYVDLLPDFHAKYEIHRDANLRFSYFRAINRPSFFEIVPYNIINEDYKERGNPDLKHTTADNFDLRYEYFPRSSEEWMVGLFYKKIMSPIEFGMMSGFGQDTYYMPMNFGNAYNYGLEADVTKYFNQFGFKANYTFTQSNITTTKMDVIPNPDPNAETNYITQYVNQTRPLYGQAAHVANLSLLWKDKKNGWDAQVAGSYTGKRLVIVSRYLDEDTWQAGYFRVDASLEKRLKSGFTLFVKASNLLDTPMIQYIHPNKTDDQVTGIARENGGRVDRIEKYGQNLMIGVRYKL